ncbi:hypothetical protein HC251_24265 [Iamia sp. SCSIO 61187]|uniref:hypothetical protein n=1 Tax=Iamia sp. SCSIO 61187 TaxID=2722752 RepID=UPI001C63141D|nr:hypothetical protein [Iamia sp. SCSIO 61187]QYG95236.1 hypothetical protein HC251_24265 [Iamia sp. SCSIO 61187]
MKKSRTRTAGRVALATVLSAGLLLTACGDDDDSTASDDTAAETTEESTETTEEAPLDDATTEVEDGVLTVELVDYAFENLPESVPAGTQLAVENTSTEEFHELIAFRLPDDEERTSDELVELPEDELMALFAGPPATVLLAGPDGGEQTAAVGDGTLTEPGRYVLFCSIPTGADPAELEAQAADPEAGPPAEDPDAGPPHFVHGMHADLVVE